MLNSIALYQSYIGYNTAGEKHCLRSEIPARSPESRCPPSLDLRLGNAMMSALPLQGRMHQNCQPVVFVKHHKAENTVHT